MKHLKLKPNKHLILVEVSKEIPPAFLEKVSDRLTSEFPEFKILLTQADVSILTLEDDEVNND